MIALLIIIMQKLGFEQELANKLYGFAEGIMGAGSLIGAASAGIFAKKLKAERGYVTILISALTLLPIGIVLTISGNSNKFYDYNCPDRTHATKHINTALHVNGFDYTRGIVDAHNRSTIYNVKAIKYIRVNCDENCEKGKYHSLKLISWHKFYFFSINSGE